MENVKSTEHANLFDCFKVLNPMRERSRRKSKSSSQKNKELESVEWMEVSSKVRTAEAQIEYVEEAESSWAEFWVEDNAEIYDDLEVVYSDIKIESLRRKPNIKRKCSPVVENMTNRLTENIFEDLIKSAFEEKMDDFLRSKDGHRNMKPSNSVENTSSTNSEESEASFETIVRRNSTRERRSLSRRNIEKLRNFLESDRLPVSKTPKTPNPVFPFDEISSSDESDFKFFAPQQTIPKTKKRKTKKKKSSRSNEEAEIIKKTLSQKANMSITVEHSSKGSLKIEIQDDSLFDLLLNHRARGAELSETEVNFAEKLENCFVLAEGLNKRLEKMNDRIANQLQIQEPAISERHNEPYRTPSPIKFMLPKLKPVRSSSVPGVDT